MHSMQNCSNAYSLSWYVYKVDLVKGHQVRKVKQLRSFKLCHLLQSHLIASLHYRKLIDLQAHISARDRGSVTSLGTLLSFFYLTWIISSIQLYMQKDNVSQLEYLIPLVLSTGEKASLVAFWEPLSWIATTYKLRHCIYLELSLQEP